MKMNWDDSLNKGYKSHIRLRIQIHPYHNTSGTGSSILLFRIPAVARSLVLLIQ